MIISEHKWRHTINHLFPSRTNFAGFFAIRAWGFDGLIGRFGEAVAAGTLLLALNSGFLWVISDLSTLRRPAVTASPRFNSAKTAAAPPAGGAGADVGAIPTGGGGGGGGGAGAVDSTFAVENSARGTPYGKGH